jgi:hypothetical protein
LNFHPKAGSKYSIEVNVTGFYRVKATDIVPYKIQAKACFDSENYNTPYAWINTTFRDRPLQPNFYWLDLQVTNYARLCEYIPFDSSTYYCLARDSTRTVTESLNLIHSYTTIPDNFNASVDNTLRGVTAFEHFMRIEDKAIDGDKIEVRLTSIGDPMYKLNEIDQLSDSQFVTFNVISASQHFDRYMKSSLIYILSHTNYTDENSGFNPFAEITQTYSNVENGKGIFAAYNTTSVKIGNLCNEQ